MNPTHVLMWHPPYLRRRSSTGAWVLVFAEGGDVFRETTEFARYASKDALAQWAATQLGCPVELVIGEQAIRVHRFGRLRREPMFWVYPVVTP